MSTTTGWRVRGAAVLLAIVGCFVAVSSAHAAFVNGIADENLNKWSSQTWTVFEGIGVKPVRHLVPWNVALPGHAGELKEVQLNAVAAFCEDGIGHRFDHLPASRGGGPSGLQSVSHLPPTASRGSNRPPAGRLDPLPVQVPGRV
jgi:hypothetical protein